MVERSEEKDEKGREMWGIRGRIGRLCSRVATQAGLRADEDGCKMSDGVGEETGEKTMYWEWEGRAEVNLKSCLRDLREELAEISLQVERLERAMPWESCGSSSSSGGSDWAWWVRTGAKMNSASKRRVSRAVHQSLSRTYEVRRRHMTITKREQLEQTRWNAEQRVTPIGAAQSG